MTVSTFIFGLAFGLGVINQVGAFVPSSSSPSINRSASSKSALSARNGRNLSEELNGVAVASIFAFGLLFPVNNHVNNAVAAERSPHQLEHSLYSSDVVISEIIRTMDFALPSSYDNIATTSVDKEELTKEVDTLKAGSKDSSVKKAPAKEKIVKEKTVKVKTEKKTKEKSKKSDSEIKLSPSERKAASKQALAERQEAREAEELQKRDDELKRALETQENIKAAREAKIAARAAQQAEDDAATASKAE